MDEKIRFSCECGKGFRVDPRHAGKKTTCPDCGTVIRVPESKPATKRPNKADSVRTKAAAPAANEFDFSQLGQEQETESTAASESSATPYAPPRKRGPSQTVLIAGGAAGGLLLLVLAALFLSGSAVPESKLVLQWPDDERNDAKLYIDGNARDLPAKGPVSFDLTAGRHTLQIRRDGFQDITTSVEIIPGQDKDYAPRWRRPFVAQRPSNTSNTSNTQTRTAKKPPIEEFDLSKLPGNPGAENAPDPAPTQANTTGRSKGRMKIPKWTPASFDGWVQDLEAAKQAAQAEDKDLLLFFNGSDWCPPCMAIARNVFFHDDFKQQATGKFVPVFLDFPRTPQAQRKVQDMKRNVALQQRYGITSYPTVVLADQFGQPYSYLGGYSGESPQEYLDKLDQAQSIRVQRDKIFDLVDSAEGVEKLKQAEKALKWIEEKAKSEREGRYAQLYMPSFEKWLALSREHDPQNEAGLHELFFEVKWCVDGQAVNEELGVGMFVDEDGEITEKGPSDEAKKRLLAHVKKLDDWEQGCRFKDSDRGARMHVYAARWLSMVEEIDAAAKHMEAGLAYQPKDKNLAAFLRRGASSIRQLGSGTGFVIAPNGYLLTNHHVIEGEKGYLVAMVPRSDGTRLEIPAVVKASDADRDVALVKIDVPQGVDLKPLPLGTELGRGSGVAAFGYPLGETIGSSLKLTRGIVSSMPEAANQGMLLLDCRINPGNSGGPVCDTRGNVVGMVTAKFGGFDIDSYGMAVPAEDLMRFLGKELSGWKPAANPNSQEMGWDKIDPLVSPSVLMIVRMRGEPK